MIYVRAVSLGVAWRAFEPEADERRTAGQLDNWTTGQMDSWSAAANDDRQPPDEIPQQYHTATK